MRILMVGGHMAAMRADLMINSIPPSIYRDSTSTLTLPDGSEIMAVSVNTVLDVDRLRGLRFDAIIEHHTFKYNYSLMNQIRAIVLRPESGR